MFMSEYAKNAAIEYASLANSFALFAETISAPIAKRLAKLASSATVRSANVPA